VLGFASKYGRDITADRRPWREVRIVGVRDAECATFTVKETKIMLPSLQEFMEVYVCVWSKKASRIKVVASRDSWLGLQSSLMGQFWRSQLYGYDWPIYNSLWMVHRMPGDYLMIKRVLLVDCQWCCKSIPINSEQIRSVF
jgi:hypothetical protein